MKIKLDENFPAQLAVVLTRLGHDVDTVAQQGLRGADDPAVWEAAQASGRFLITQDMDLAESKSDTTRDDMACRDCPGSLSRF
jgi:predicted nuclease of predicted toxin-antitoxin system